MEKIKKIKFELKKIFKIKAKKNIYIMEIDMLVTSVNFLIEKILLYDKYFFFSI